MTTLRQLSGFDTIYAIQVEEAMQASVTLAYTMAEEDKVLHDALYTNEVGSEEWYVEVTKDTLDVIPEADEYWPLVEEFIKLNTSDDDIALLMESLSKVDNVLTSIPDYLSRKMIEDIGASTKEVMQ